jgi:hypothetical protein
MTRSCLFLLMLMILGLGCSRDRNKSRTLADTSSTSSATTSLPAPKVDSIGDVLSTVAFLRSIPGTSDMRHVRSLAESERMEWNERAFELRQRAGIPNTLTFSTEHASEFNCEFINNRFRSADLNVILSDPEAMAFYRKLVDSMSARIGQPISVSENIEPPFRESESIHALRVNKAQYEAIWSLAKDPASLSLSLFPIAEDDRHVTVFLQYTRK